MELRISAVDVKLFTISVQYRTFVAEASDLFEYRLKQRLYDTSADVGFGLWNAGTNAVTRWVHEKDIRDGEGDITVTYYTPTPETLCKFPQLKGWKIHILND
jgi:hypothetical protein